MKDRNKKNMVDASLRRLSKKVTDGFGPLAKVWEVIEACEDGSIDPRALDFAQVSENLRFFFSNQVLN